MRALEDKVILRVINQEKTTPLGIVLISEEKPRTHKCEVISIGEKCKLVKEGNIVIIDVRSPLSFAFYTDNRKKEKYVSMPEKDILAVVE